MTKLCIKFTDGEFLVLKDLVEYRIMPQAPVLEVVTENRVMHYPLFNIISYHLE